MKHLNLIVLLMIALTLAACSTTNANSTPDESSAAESEPAAADVVAATESATEPTPEPEPIEEAVETITSSHELLITAGGEGWEAAESTPAGWTAVTLENQSNAMRQSAFLRLDDDRTMDDVFAAIEAGMEGIPEWMTAYGGVSGVMPGEARSVTANLPQGQYIVIDPVPEADGVPGMAKGFFMPLSVEASETETAPPTADLALELVDYSFAFDEEAIQSGPQQIHVTNSGPQEAHEVVVIKLDDGAAVQDFVQYMGPNPPDGPPPGQIVAGTAAFDEAAENYLEVDFEAGATYAFVCFTPSTQHGGEPHFMHGMMRQFDVPE